MTMAADKQNKVLNVPNLRFPEFTEEWNYAELHELAPSISSGRDKPTNGSIALYGSTGQMGMTDKASYTNEIVLVARVGANAGTMQIVNEPCGVTDNALVVNAGLWNKYIFYYLQKCNLNRLIFGSGQPLITGGMLKKIKIRFGSEVERAKIIKFLILIDERISTQIRVIDKLKSLMQGLNNELMNNPKWDKVYVGDFMEFFPTNSFSWEQLNYDNGQVRNLHYGLVHNGLPTLVDCQKESLPYIQDSSLPKQYTACKDGDVAFADASEDTTEVGKVVELTNIGDKIIVCGLHTIHGRDVKAMTVKGFKGFAFNSKFFHDQLRRIAQGSKVYSINTDNLKSCYLHIPTVAEQQKIVGLLRCMQEKIEVAEHGLQLYKAQKQFLLRGLFV